MKQTGIIVGVNVNNHEYFKEEMVELKNLCDACDINIVGDLVQNAKSIHPKLYLGKGKLEELAAMVQEANIDVVIFNNELTPSQIKHIDEALQVEVIDRTNLILRIFASRAKTREAKLQVEVVRLQYELPRLIGLSSNLSRQAGGIGGGTGAGARNKGAGETKLELNRRQIDDKITMLLKELEGLKVQRTTQRSKRNKNGMKTVALVGYTNAGKSSIMNYMVQHFIGSEEKQVLEKDMLFATLETSVRNIRLKNNHEFLLSDTVGFVSNLPHNLVKAFRSTLEEVCEADLLLHVVDRSNPDYLSQMEVTNQTLKEIGADQIRTVCVYNKADLWKQDEECELDSAHAISTRTGEGMEEMIEEICSILYEGESIVRVLIPYDRGSLIAKINASANILSQECMDTGIEYELKCSENTRSLVEAFQI